MVKKSIKKTYQLSDLLRYPIVFKIVRLSKRRRMARDNSISQLEAPNAKNEGSKLRFLYKQSKFFFVSS